MLQLHNELGGGEHCVYTCTFGVKIFLYVVLLLESTKPCSFDKEIQHCEIMVCMFLHVVHLMC